MRLKGKASNDREDQEVWLTAVNDGIHPCKQERPKLVSARLPEVQCEKMMQWPSFDWDWDHPCLQ